MVGAPFGSWNPLEIGYQKIITYSTSHDSCLLLCCYLLCLPWCPYNPEAGVRHLLFQYIALSVGNTTDIYFLTKCEILMLTLSFPNCPLWDLDVLLRALGKRHFPLKIHRPGPFSEVSLLWPCFQNIESLLQWLFVYFIQWVFNEKYISGPGSRDWKLSLPLPGEWHLTVRL